MAGYIDGFLLVVPTKNVEAYRRVAKVGAKVWKEHGALAYFECVGEDLASRFGWPFPKRVKAKPDETVVFSWILYKSRAHRDRVNAKVMKDPRMTKMPEPMPFDLRKMSHGGFEVLVRA
ncbi:MAG TPA: DUF1428 domain-containing protein [Myxococcaceae bacterium]|nr:DUF1428 domain-containing protein [Myxococcaceae bacterium]